MSALSAVGLALVGAFAAVFGVSAALDRYTSFRTHAVHVFGYGFLLACFFGFGLGVRAGIAAFLCFALPYALGAAEIRDLKRRGRLP